MFTVVSIDCADKCDRRALLAKVNAQNARNSRFDAKLSEGRHQWPRLAIVAAGESESETRQKTDRLAEHNFVILGQVMCGSYGIVTASDARWRGFAINSMAFGLRFMRRP